MITPFLNDAVTRQRVAERFPPIFSRLPDRIFAPLASPNRHQYWKLLCALYAKRFGPEAELPPSVGFLSREITADIAEELQFHSEWSAEGEDIQPATPLAIRAVAIFNRLRDAGWLRVDRVGVREMVLMPPAAAHFMNRLLEFANTGPEYLSGKIRSVEANLRIILDQPDADGSSLQEAARQSRALIENVRIAGTNVRDLMTEISRSDATHEFVGRFFTEYVSRIFIADYKELRTRDHPLARRQEILRLLIQIQTDQGVRNRLLNWYTLRQAQGDLEKAEAMFERDISKIDDLRVMDRFLDRLDEEVRRANKIALAYLDYRLRGVRPMDQLIGQAISVVNTHGSRVSDISPFPPGDCVSAERLAAPRAESKRLASSPLRKQVMSPEHEARARLNLLARERRSVSIPKLAKFVRDQISQGDQVYSTTLKVNDIPSVRAFQMLALIAMANTSGSRTLQSNSRSMSSGFTTTRPINSFNNSEEHATDFWISHKPFLIIRTK